MTKTDALYIMSIKHHPAVTDAQLQRQKLKICTAARKWRQAQKRGSAAFIADEADVTNGALMQFERGELMSARILGVYIRLGFDPEPVRVLKALDGCSEENNK